MAADGTIDWLCRPNYDSPSLFGALLNAGRGGFWRFGPAEPTPGRQRYLDESAALVTSWTVPGGELEPTDTMAWPHDERPAGEGGWRAILRRLRCRRGRATGVLELRPRHDFDGAATATLSESGVAFMVGECTLNLWVSRPVAVGRMDAPDFFELRERDEIWAILALGQTPPDWSVGRAREELARIVAYWRGWSGRLAYRGPREPAVRRSALAVHPLSSAPTSSLVHGGANSPAVRRRAPCPGRST